MLQNELEELAEAVRRAEAALENAAFPDIDKNLARYIKAKETHSRAIK